MEYVYMYMHPEHGYVYIGRTNNLKNRINEHNNGQADNIDRQYMSLLNECIIYYIELDNKALSVSAEAFLINKYKPILNKAFKYDNKNNNCSKNISMNLPKWKLYSLGSSLKDIYEIKNADDSITKLRKELEHREDELKIYNNMIDSCKTQIKSSQKQITYFTSISNKTIKIDTCIGFSLEEIILLYKNFDILDIQFHGKTYNIIGNEIAHGIIYAENDTIVYEYKYSETELNEKYIIEHINDTIPYNNYSGYWKKRNWIVSSTMLDKFYPNQDIYEQLYYEAISKQSISRDLDCLINKIINSIDTNVV